MSRRKSNRAPGPPITQSPADRRFILKDAGFPPRKHRYIGPRLIGGSHEKNLRGVRRPGLVGGSIRAHRTRSAKICAARAREAGRSAQARQWVWEPQIAPDGPVLVYVDLGRQRATVYRNGVRIGVSTISSGKDGHETPTGVFTILEKNKEHRSKTYNDASMPYQQRLTWLGVAMHAGNLPGYPASHGCVRLPMEFAKKLFEVTPMGGTVVIAGGNEDPVKRPAAGVLAPAMAGVTPQAARCSRPRRIYLEPAGGSERAGVDHRSTGDQQVVVLRNGVEIGRAHAVVAGQTTSRR